METFSLLQVSLDQTIERALLEDATDAAPSVARADCARMLRDLFGILVSRLPKPEALAFQKGLASRGFPTELVADRDLPVLHESFQVQRVARKDPEIEFTDSLGRTTRRPVSDLVFLAGGMIERIEFKSVTHQRLDFDGRDGGMPKLVTEREVREQAETGFQLDFFFWSAPNRVNLTLGKENAIFHHGNPLRLRDRAGLCGLMFAMADVLPAERLNRGLGEPQSDFVYPSWKSYEEEIRWHFHQLSGRK